MFALKLRMPIPVQRTSNILYDTYRKVMMVVQNLQIYVGPIMSFLIPEYNIISTMNITYFHWGGGGAGGGGGGGGGG